MADTFEHIEDAHHLQKIDRIIAKFGTSANAVIPILQAIQEEYRYLPEAVLRYVCDNTDITPASIIGVSTFYTQFRHKPVGEHIIRVKCEDEQLNQAAVPLEIPILVDDFFYLLLVIVEILLEYLLFLH